MENFDFKKYLAEGILLKETIINEDFPKWRELEDEEKERISKFVKDTGDRDQAAYERAKKERMAAQSAALSKYINGDKDESIQEGQGDDLLTLVQDYISNDFTLDQGYGDAVGKAEEEQPMLRDKIIQLKGEDYFSKVEKVANLLTYEAEYVTADESEKLEQQIQDLAEELGFTKDELSGM
jgi:hypothetical protein